jgi:hypothetical protein
MPSFMLFLLTLCLALFDFAVANLYNICPQMCINKGDHGELTLWSAACPNQAGVACWSTFDLNEMLAYDGMQLIAMP